MLSRSGLMGEIKTEKPWHNQRNIRFFSRKEVTSFPGLPTIQYLFTYSWKNKGRRFTPLIRGMALPLVPTLEGQRNGSTFSPHPWGSEEWLCLQSPPLKIRGIALPLVPALEDQRNGSSFSPHPWGSAERLCARGARIMQVVQLAISSCSYTQMLILLNHHSTKDKHSLSIEGVLL